MAGFERNQGTSYVLVGKMEFDNGLAAKTVKQALIQAGFDLQVERKERNFIEKIKVYAREVI